MIRMIIAGCLVGLMLAAGAAAQQPKDSEIDFKRAKMLLDKERKGEKLTKEEQAYLEKAKEAIRQRNQPGQAQGPARGGKDSTGLVPLNDLGSDKYKGETGGLYGDGKNEPPARHLAAALREAAKIRPLDADGKPDDQGKIVLISIGMSNTTQEFSTFMRLAKADSAKSDSVVIVDGAQGGQAAEQWNGGNAGRVWGTLDNRLSFADASPRQVQVLWLKQALIQQGRFGDFPQHAHSLEEENLKILCTAREHFPNLRIAYLSSRIYAGYATTQLNPEPYAYEGAFSVRWLIKRQIDGDEKLNYDPNKGIVVAPLLLWGPYLWADGQEPRKADKLTWLRTDLTPGDGTHPSPAGQKKVAELLLNFLKTDPTAKVWFTKG